MACIKISPVVRGLLCVFGGFLIQLVVGSFHGTFGNMLPYLTSYRRQTDPSLTNGDLSVILPGAGITQGFAFLIGGFFLVPLLGVRLCLMLGCFIYVLAPILGYLVLDMPIALLTVCLGSLAGIGMSITGIPVMLIPVQWFPNSKGKVVGVIAAGFGLASTVFTPLQTLIINPDNVLPVNMTNSSNMYFQDPDLLNRIPMSLLYIAMTYGILSLVGILLCVENPDVANKNKKDSKLDVIRNSFVFLYKSGFRNRDFYLLWFTRYSMLVVCGGILSHWKAFGLVLNSDDRLISLIGGANGILNACSRFLTGVLMDRFPFRVVMPVLCVLICIILSCIYWVGHAAFEGYCALIWLLYLLTFSHFASVPAQAIRLFKSESSIILGGIGLSDSVSYMTVMILNQICMTSDRPLFMPFFLSLAVFAALAAVATAFVRDEDTDEQTFVEKVKTGERKLSGMNEKELESYSNKAYVKQDKRQADLDTRVA